jgi:hypothetical protein
MAENYDIATLNYNMNVDYLREDFIHSYLFRISEVYNEGGVHRGIVYGLNCKYGIELEFQACDTEDNHTRYSIGNRINNCIVNQNSDDFYKYQFNLNNAITIRNQQIAQDANPLPTIIDRRNADTFNEWTNFLLEVNDGYHSSTHNGTPSLVPQRGQSGFKIEFDPGVRFNTTHGLTSRTYVDSASPIFPGALLHRTRFPDGWYTTTCNVNDILQHLAGRGPHGTLIANQLELVSPILVNEPFLLNGNILPLGYTMIDNMVNHLKTHSNVIFTQNDAFHIHLSKNQKTPPALRGGPELSQIEIVGFAKLFWLFEPLFFAGHPIYKSTNDIPGYQSLQSLFNYDEIQGGMPDDEIYRRLIREDGIAPGAGRIRREIPGQYRYCALNVMNTLPHQIGTIEIRVGHSTMQSNLIQMNIQIYQLLFHLNLYFIHCKPNAGNVLYEHNTLLTSVIRSCIPHYCRQTSAQYDVPPPNINNVISIPPDITNAGRPIKGFFKSCGDNDYRTRIINNLGLLFTQLTGAIELMTLYQSVINIWHSNMPPLLGDDKTLDSVNYPCYFSNTLNVVNFGCDRIHQMGYRALTYEPLAPDVYSNAVLRRRRTPPGDSSTIPMVLSIMFRDYVLLNPGVNTLDNPSKSCSTNIALNRYPAQYNVGLPLTERNTLRQNVADNRSQTHVFTDDLNPANHTGYIHQHQKSQTELLNFKISNGQFLGGKKSKNKKIDNRRTKKRYKMYSGGFSFGNDSKGIAPTNLSTPVIEYDLPVINLNKGKDGYNIKKDKSQFILYRTNNFTEIITVDDLLSKIINELLQQHIISEEELVLMNKNNYIEIDLFVNDKFHNQLLSELSEIKGLSMDDAKLQKIKNVYKNIYRLL